jgi:ATP-dependent DNA ligase
MRLRSAGETSTGVACERDLEGIVAKWAQGTYQSNGRGTSWLKIEPEVFTDGRAP